MPADAPTILATSGGYREGSRTWLEFGPLVHHAVDLSGVHGRRPRVTVLGTASGDQRWFAAEVHQAGAVAGFDVTVLDLFSMPSVEDVPTHLREQDVVWVGGGSVANLLAVWAVHDVGTAMRAAWEAGVVLSGVSAGSICWFVGGTTDSFGPRLRAVTNGLALLPYGNGVHHDSEPGRRPLVRALVADGTLPTTHCTDDGAGLVYRGTELVGAVTERPGAGAYVVTREGEDVVEERLDVALLP
ncbi:Type 1 glutamine amidotransferase-like domain-containing protein [Phycicoccus flavus]|uniref:Type 1 glutamine amidotransferase-like domain-containing protein n=1 Tax=Phycicoccus flavus TaxID=2502783 RepID=UPI000FEBEE6B|nr:peptidase E [Phycicoccus flavus]NHA67118.1 peptidase E [Phycicoccus flavus]